MAFTIPARAKPKLSLSKRPPEFRHSLFLLFQDLPLTLLQNVLHPAGILQECWILPRSRPNIANFRFAPRQASSGSEFGGSFFQSC